MDEPFGHLDAQTRYLMQEDLMKIWEKEKRTIVFVTNNIEEAIYLADRIIVDLPHCPGPKSTSSSFLSTVKDTLSMTGTLPLDVSKVLFKFSHTIISLLICLSRSICKVLPQWPSWILPEYIPQCQLQRFPQESAPCCCCPGL